MVQERFFKGPSYDNLGIAYNGGTGVFTIQGANGRALSSSNPAYVILPSKTTPGEFVRYLISANQSFIDDVGASEIIGNLFGWTTSVAITDDVPFFIYAVGNDDEDSIAIMLCRKPGLSESPTAANIGAPDDAVADKEGDFWSVDNIDETLYDSNPCFCIGSYRMVMSASDDWTVQTIDNANIDSIGDGIGYYQEGVLFTVPLGQLGANAGSWLVATGGTQPVFSSLTQNQYTFSGNVSKTRINLDMSGDGGTDGTGANLIVVTTPFSGRSGLNRGDGFVQTPTTITYAMFQVSAAAAQMDVFIINGTAALVNTRNTTFPNGNRAIDAYFEYDI